MGEEKKVYNMYFANLLLMLVFGFAKLPKDDADKFAKYVKSWNPNINLRKICGKETCIVFFRREK